MQYMTNYHNFQSQELHSSLCLLSYQLADCFEQPNLNC
uniref:Uncharacterized protein n=1 Tax=virus sp. ctML55 TaxID=2827627 RepID=A0A8S5RIE5_9VIRU|nr:MAG TPA: hypothetical protein [virus sp. ctML55]